MFATQRLLAVAALFALVPPTSPQGASSGNLDMSDGYVSSHPVVVVNSIADGEPLEGITVTVQSATGLHASTSDAFGYAVLPNLTITPDPVWSTGNVPDQERVTISIADPLYVPVRAERMLAEGTMSVGIGLTPRSVGGITSWVTATTGGSFSIPGIGTLTVPPGVLLQDAFLHVTTVPDYGQSSAQFQDQLVHQVWLGSLDRAGNWVNALPVTYSGITLATEPTILPFPKGTVLAEHWVSHFVDDRFVETGQQAMATPVGRRAVIPVVDGSNLVTRTWNRFPFAPGSRGGADGQANPVENDCGSTTEIVTKEIGSRIVEVSGSPMLCGFYANSASGEISNGQTITGTSALKLSVIAEVGATLKTVLSEISSKLGSKVEVDTSTGTSTSTIRVGTAAVVQNESLMGGQCFNAEVVIGIVMKKYRIFHIQREVCPDGSIERTTTNMGDIEVSSGIKVWWKNMAFDGTCPGCAGTNPTPPNVPGTPMF